MAFQRGGAEGGGTETRGVKKRVGALPVTSGASAWFVFNSMDSPPAETTRFNPPLGRTQVTAAKTGGRCRKKLKITIMVKNAAWTMSAAQISGQILDQPRFPPVPD
jgi:hypothetical protein